MDDLSRGLLEQACPDCGRWEAAGATCSWCGRPMTGADWYRNGDLARRRGVLPATAPADPPSEYRDVIHWPQAWGPCPYAKGLHVAVDPGRSVDAPARAVPHYPRSRRAHERRRTP